MTMLVSIAMAVRNAARFLPEALASVPAAMAGSGAEYEIVAADGASTDATVSILQAAPKARIVSAADGGIYDGMNRAIAAARGDVLILLNGDDLLLPGGIGAALGALDRSPAAAMASGGARFGKTGEAGLLRLHRGPLTAEGALFGIPAINARLFRTDALRRLGPLLTDVGLGSDREYLLRACTSGLRGVGVAEPIYHYRSHEDSQTISGDKAGRTRVYRAEAQLAAHVIGAYGDADQVVRLARASHALASAKIKVTGDSVTAAPGKSAASNVFDFARAVPLALKWRGVLSGA